MNRREETCSHMLRAAESLLKAAVADPDKVAAALVREAAELVHDAREVLARDDK